MPDVARVAFVLTLLPFSSALAKDRATPPATARIELRVVDASGAPRAGCNVNAGSALSARTGADGRASFAVQGRLDYTLWIDEAPGARVDSRIAWAVVMDGLTLDLGVVTVDACPVTNKPSWNPAPRIAPLPGVGNPPADFAVAGAYALPSNRQLFATNIRVVTGDGRIVNPAPDEMPHPVRQLAIAPDAHALGWSEFGVLPERVVVYERDQPLHRFPIDGHGLSGWRFDGNTRVVIEDSHYMATNSHSFSLDPETMPHFELRDIATGDLVDKWFGRIKRSTPQWVRAISR